MPLLEYIFISYREIDCVPTDNYPLIYFLLSITLCFCLIHCLLMKLYFCTEQISRFYRVFDQMNVSTFCIIVRRTKAS